MNQCIFGSVFCRALAGEPLYKNRFKIYISVICEKHEIMIQKEYKYGQNSTFYGPKFISRGFTHSKVHSKF